MLNQNRESAMIDQVIRNDLARWEMPRKLTSRDTHADYGPYLSDCMVFKCPLTSKNRVALVSQTGIYWILPAWRQGGTMTLFNGRRGIGWEQRLGIDTASMFDQVKEVMDWVAYESSVSFNDSLYFPDSGTKIDMSFDTCDMNYGETPDEIETFLRVRVELVKSWAAWAEGKGFSDPLRAMEIICRSARQRHLRAYHTRKWRANVKRRGLLTGELV